MSDIETRRATLAVPELGDDLQTTARKVEGFAQALKRGDNVALLTGLKLVPDDLRHRGDPEALAKLNMDQRQREMYEAWKKNNIYIMPFDWNNAATIPNGTHSLKKFSERAEAMDAVWHHQGATPENASWLTFNMPDALPLVHAVHRVMKAEKHMKTQKDPWAGLTNEEVWELVTLNRFAAIVEHNYKREIRKYRGLVSQTFEIMKMFNARLVARVDEWEENGQIDPVEAMIKREQTDASLRQYPDMLLDLQRMEDGLGLGSSKRKPFGRQVKRRYNPY